LRRMIKCKMIGTAISAVPASRETLRKVIEEVFSYQYSVISFILHPSSLILFYPRAARLAKYSVKARSNCMLVSRGT
jgi:Na+/H+-dicarboxylate symporter